MKPITEKGSAVLEFMVILPIFLFCLGVYWRFVRASSALEWKIISEQQKYWEDLKTREASLPVSKRPCLAHQEICAQR